jgi:hypothetical protein
LAKWLGKSELTGEFIQQSDKLFHKDFPRTWWMRTISPAVRASKEDQAETLAGLHNPHLLLIVDEASGVPDPTYIPLEGALTQEDNIILLIGNMTKNNGYFYDTHFHVKEKHNWVKLHWDSRKSEIVTPAYCEKMANKYGIDSNIFRIRVEGNPPLSDEKQLIPFAWAEQCIDNEINISEGAPIYLAVDVARFGDDYSVILPRQELNIMPYDKFQKIDTMELGGRVNLAFEKYEAQGIAIDTIGVGGGVYDWLYKHHNRNTVFGVNVTVSATDQSKYHRLRDELWWRVREKCRQGMYCFPSGEQGRDLVNEITSIYIKEFDHNGAIVVESKKDMKLRGKESPNIGDALCISEFFYDYAYKLFTHKPAEKKKTWRERLRSTGPSRYGWMTS